MTVLIRKTGPGVAPGASRGAWPDGWPVPSIGHQVLYEDFTFTVTDVLWYPGGEPGEDAEPFVYVIVRNDR